MKKLSYFLILLFAASVVFTGCRSNEDPDPEYIVVDDGELTQSVYADEVAGESGVRITTFAPWRSEIREITTTAATETTRNAVDWVSIDPSSGDIGEYILTISLEVNHRGEDRSAEISIISGSTVITIIITQQGLTECGYVPPYVEEELYIVVDNESALNQTVFANRTEGASVRFITVVPWTSSIREATTAATVDWVSISPESSSAGLHTINILLTPNFTGANRSAIIAITSGSTTIEIRITQVGVNEDGIVPQNPQDHSIIRAENIIGDDFSEIVTVKVGLNRGCCCYGTEEFLVIAEAPFQNNGFTLHLPQAISESYLHLITEHWRISRLDLTIVR